jgi:hypothetical protein
MSVRTTSVALLRLARSAIKHIGGPKADGGNALSRARMERAIGDAALSCAEAGAPPGGSPEHRKPRRVVRIIPVRPCAVLPALWRRDCS